MKIRCGADYGRSGHISAEYVLYRSRCVRLGFDIDPKDCYKVMQRVQKM